MSGKNADWECERGNIILIALGVLIVLTLLGAVIVQVGGMEYKSSCNDYEAQQAQQAADAGIDWATEIIYRQLVDDQFETELPISINLSTDMNPKKLGLNINNEQAPSFEITDWQARRASDPLSNPAIYKIGSIGNFGRAHKTIEVQISYPYNGGVIDTVTGHYQTRDYSQSRGYIYSYIVK